MFLNVNGGLWHLFSTYYFMWVTLSSRNQILMCLLQMLQPWSSRLFSWKQKGVTEHLSMCMCTLWVLLFVWSGVLCWLVEFVEWANVRTSISLSNWHVWAVHRGREVIIHGQFHQCVCACRRRVCVCVCVCVHAVDVSLYCACVCVCVCALQSSADLSSSFSAKYNILSIKVLKIYCTL